MGEVGKGRMREKGRREGSRAGEQNVDKAGKRWVGWSEGEGRDGE